MEAFLAVGSSAGGQVGQVQVDDSSGNTPGALRGLGKSPNSNNNSPSSTNHNSKPALGLPFSRRSGGDLLDNGHYWKFIEGSSGMLPTESPPPASLTGGGLEDSITRLKASKDKLLLSGSKDSSEIICPGSKDHHRPSINAIRDTAAGLSLKDSPLLPKDLLGSKDHLSLARDSQSALGSKDHLGAPEPSFPKRRLSSSCSDESVGGLFRGMQVPNNCLIPSGTPVPGSHSGPPAPGSEEGGLSDVERFDGKIVYNPDGSAYIIEESELSGEEEGLEVQEGSIVTGPGFPQPPPTGLPQIANAFYVSRNPALYSALYGQAVSRLLGNNTVPDVPLMHSYRVYTVRDNNKCSSGGGDEGQREPSDPSPDLSSTTPTSYSSVPIKPILMCFNCKLSFGYTKSFVSHAVADHSLVLTDRESDLLATPNVSAIIQAVGRSKETLISFLEPIRNSIGPVPMNVGGGRGASSLLLNSAVPSSATTTEITSPKNSKTPPEMTTPDTRQQDFLKQIDLQKQLGIDLQKQLTMGMDLTRKSPAGSGRSSVSPGNSISPIPNSNNAGGPPNSSSSPSGSSFSQQAGPPPNFMTGTTIGVCPEHMNGRPSGVDCGKCELILNSSRMGALGSLHTRNSCKTLKCPKCNWHYKYQETLEIHMKEKHPDNETSCIYCIAAQPHPRLARGETYTCGYKPYRCEVCNYSTTTKGNLSIHMQSDKHLNNMQELQNGGVASGDTNTSAYPPPSTPSPQQQAMSHHQGGHSQGHKVSPGSSSSTPTLPANPKPKPTFRCDVCNYETNVARNLRIHMTSEKHTHNMMVLQQNVKHMQHLSALQAQAPYDLFHQHQQGGDNKGVGGSSVNEATLADMAYNQALLIQMMTGGQMPPHIPPPDLAPHMDLGLNPDTMEPPPEPPDPNPSHLFTCCVCTAYNSDSLESLSHHLTADRTKLRESEILVLVAGNYLCKLCSYKTNLKANFQLHCKTDKHLQRLQHVNHIKEGGIRNEWKLKYLSMSNPIQVRCNACDYYTNSAHKLQLHAAHQRHEISVLIFRHIQAQEPGIQEDSRIYACALCGFTSRTKLQLLQHTRSLKHLQLEQLHSLQRRAEGKDGIPDLAQVFRVLEQPSESESPGPGQANNNHSSHHNSSATSALMDYYNNDGADKKDDHRSRSNSSVLKSALEKEDQYSDLSCPYCTFVTDSESRLSAHVTTQHSASDSLKSNTSSKTGGHQSTTTTTTSDNSPTNTRISCPLCQETCMDRSRLEAHVGSVHSVNAEGLARLLMLVNQSHWLSSGGGGVYGGGGSASDQSAADKSDSESPEGSDTGDEYRCTACSKPFPTLDHLATHQTTEGHLEVKGPGYLCWKKGCNQYFPTAPSLQVHFREIHARGKGGVAVSEKHVYKYRCSQCSLAFKTLEKLQLHSQYHAIRDASKCCLCGRSFRSLLALQKHVETGHTELSEEDLAQFKLSIGSNPGQINNTEFNPANIPEFERNTPNEFERPNIMTENYRDLTKGSGDNEREECTDEESGGDSGGSSKDDQHQLFEDYLNTQAMAEDSYNDPSRKYKCHRCRVAFTRQSYLTSHNKTLLHRKGEKLSYPMEKYLDPNRPYKCEVCKESFTQKNILLVHYNSVSHLHKLKRAMQDQAQFLTQLSGGQPRPGPNSSPSPSPTHTPSNHRNSGSTPVTPPSAAEDEDKKPFKCNICKVAYSQGSTLDIHMRSVLHQTRASKLQELALSGQIDLSKPLIEQPEVGIQPNKRVELMSPAKGMLDLSYSSPSPSPVAQNQMATPIACPKCNTLCSTPDQLATHVHLYCMFNNTTEPAATDEGPAVAEEVYTRFSMPGRKSSQLYKHILESYGFEIVMQFNEYHQKRRRLEEEISTQQCPVADEPLDEPMIDEDNEGILAEFPELAKSTCPYCKKVFSSVWILKSHTEEIHRDVVPMEMLESYADTFRSAYIKKCEVLERLEKEVENQNQAIIDAGPNQGNVSVKVPPSAPSTPTASTTPASSADSISGGHAHQSSSNHHAATTPNSHASSINSGGAASMSLSLAQHMNDVQQALMAASQLQHFNPMLNPMMMASLGMGLPLGLNMNALAAMNLQPPLVPMMMPPPYEHMGQGQGSSQQPSPSPFQVQVENSIAKQHQQQQQQQQAQAQAQQQQQQVGNSGQKRARTRITDDQLKILRAHFDINNSPSEEQIQQMAASSGLPPKVIKHWFRNTLFKERQRNKDSPYNFSNPPSTTLNLEEYEKTGETKVKPLDAEEQKLYECPTPTPNTKTPPLPKKESHAAATAKKQQQLLQQQQQQQQQQQLQQLQQQQQLLQNVHFQAALQQQQQQEYNEAASALGAQQHKYEMESMRGDRGEFEFSETESSDERPRKKLCTGSSGKGSGGHSKSRSSGARSSSIPSLISAADPSPSGGMNLLGGLNLDLDSSSPSPQQMLPPPKGLTPFAPPPANTSLVSPLNINSPGSSCGRGEGASMTTPPLSNCPSQGSMSSGKRANRTRFTDYQIKVLQEFFENNAYPKDDDLEYLSKLLGLSPRVIVVWFQNARQKARKVYENQPPVDAPEEGAGRFQRTPGLNYQCKKCLLVFQRYYELIRHQKTHCFKEEDAKRSAQAQAAAAQVAANNNMSDDDNSNCSQMSEEDQQSISSSCAAGTSPVNGGSNMTFNINEVKGQGHDPTTDETFQCDKCSLVFPRFDLWREHQLIHIMNPNLFPTSFSPESPFGILQQHAQAQQQQLQQVAGQQQQAALLGIKMEPKDTQSVSETSSIAGDATAKRKWSADEHTTEDDEMNTDGQPRDKRLRTTILPEQLDYLYQKYQIESNPSRKMLETIAREVGLKKRVVQVWFQNTRARERKGQFRAHAQVINKRCPFCPALFKVKSALETHLAAKHSEQCKQGEVNIDALPDEEVEQPMSPLVSNEGPGSNNKGQGQGQNQGQGSAASNIMTPFLHSLSTHAELETSLKKLYEESLKRYALEVQHQQQGGGPGSVNGRANTPTDLRLLVKTEGGTATGEYPLDLSKPVDLSSSRPSNNMNDAMVDSMDTQDYLSDNDGDDDIDDDGGGCHGNSSPTTATPNKSRNSTSSHPPSAPSSSAGGNKRFRTQMSSLQVKAMKSLFADYKTPTMSECEMLGREIGLQKRVVQVWFQNARAKEKKGKLSLMKGSGDGSGDMPLTLINSSISDTTSPPAPEVASVLPTSCTLCAFVYSHKYSVQDHIFTRAHIDRVKDVILNGSSAGKGGERKKIKKDFLLNGGCGERAGIFNREDGGYAPSILNSSNLDNHQQQLNFLQMYSNAGEHSLQIPMATTPTTVTVGNVSGLKTSTAVRRKKPNATPGSKPSKTQKSTFGKITKDWDLRDAGDEPSRNVLESLNLFPKIPKTTEPGLLADAGVSSGVDASISIRSEMEYVVGKIAELARDNTGIESTLNLVHPFGSTP